MTEAGANRLWRWLAWTWLLAMLALGVQQARFWQHPAIDTDVMALLPGSGEDAALALANRHLADSVTGDVVVLLGATAAQAILGASIRVTRDRGKLLEGKFIATLHPSALLRAPDPETREKSFALLVADLELAARHASK